MKLGDYTGVPVEKLKEILVPSGYIEEGLFESAMQEAAKKRVPIESLIVEKGLISDEHLGRAIADSLNYYFIDLKNIAISEDLLNLIPEAVARAQGSILFDRVGDNLKLATFKPHNYEFLKFLERKIGRKIEIYYATPLGIEVALKSYRSDWIMAAKDLITDLEANPKNEENIVKLVNLFLEYAHDSNASDIHIEPLEGRALVRFRIDGILHEVMSYSKNMHDRIVSRIKILSRLRTDEHAAAQDGRFDHKKDQVGIDVRVSILPVTDGENVVMRLLTERMRRLSLEELGLTGKDLEKVKAAMVKPYGMILSVGPTGSGKTTTLYAVLQILNKPEVNIMTIEDPVEYDIEHIQQTQVNPAKNLLFSTGLRSIVRQDPDIVMVGEIRDNETADIAVNAAMTGHLFLSTLHANDAATTFPRLLEMGIEPFLVASSVNVVVAQRLVRKVCSFCKLSYFLTEEELKILDSLPHVPQMIQETYKKEDISKIRFYKGSGCKICNYTGYSGRTGIFEVLEVTKEMRLLIVQRMSADVIDEEAKKLGMTSMMQDGMVKVFQGVTTIDEVVRAVK